MTGALEELLEQLELEEIGEAVYRGQSRDLGWGAIFGGQVLGQALSAAGKTVEDDRAVHSFHAYFLRQGDANRPVDYDVEVMRDGVSFSTRRVRAVQGDRPIFFMSSSFQKEQQAFDHQDPMPEVAGPEGLESERDLARRNEHLIPQAMRATFTGERPIEIRPVEAMEAVNPSRSAPRRRAWMRASGRLPDGADIHAALLAYASDFSFLVTALHPHGVAWWDPKVKMASIDHGMWFHRPFRMDEWLLYSVDSPNASGARGLVRGQFFTREGTLVASTVQEGLIRRRE